MLKFLSLNEGSPHVEIENLKQLMYDKDLDAFLDDLVKYSAENPLLGEFACIINQKVEHSGYVDNRWLKTALHVAIFLNEMAEQMADRKLFLKEVIHAIKRAKKRGKRPFWIAMAKMVPQYKPYFHKEDMIAKAIIVQISDTKYPNLEGWQDKNGKDVRYFLGDKAYENLYNNIFIECTLV